MSSFALFAAGTIHLLTAGTDAANPWVQAAVAVAVTAIVYLTTVRLLTPQRHTTRIHTPPPGPRRPTASSTPRPQAQRVNLRRYGAQSSVTPSNDPIGSTTTGCPTAVT